MVNKQNKTKQELLNDLIYNSIKPTDNGFLMDEYCCYPFTKEENLKKYNTKMKTKQQIYKEFKELDSDFKRWAWVIENKNEKHFPTITLDNDSTYIYFDHSYVMDKAEEGEVVNFDDFLGWDDGVFTLLRVLGLKVEGA